MLELRRLPPRCNSPRYHPAKLARAAPSWEHARRAMPPLGGGRPPSPCSDATGAAAAIDQLLLTVTPPPRAAFPRVIHQSWKTESLPPDFRNWSQSWRRLHPSYEYRLWTDRDNHQLIADHYPWFLPVYEELDHKIKRADVVRFFYLYHFGGVYADLDFLALRPFDELLQQFRRASVLLGYLGDDPRWMHSIPNALMISKRQSPFWLHALRLMLDCRTRASHSPEVVAGPVLLRNAVLHFGNQSRVHVLAKNYFYGAQAGSAGSWKAGRSGTALAADEPEEAYAVTFWRHSWGPPPMKRKGSVSLSQRASADGAG